tara:strand:- start:270 stop:635 length:366 start_codon:yes stop_codon:yes gene_type:complete
MNIMEVPAIAMTGMSSMSNNMSNGGMAGMSGIMTGAGRYGERSMGDYDRDMTHALTANGNMGQQSNHHGEDYPDFPFALASMMPYSYSAPTPHDMEDPGMMLRDVDTYMNICGDVDMGTYQ